MIWWLVILSFIGACAMWLLLQPDSFEDYYRHLAVRRRLWRMDRKRRKASAGTDHKA